MLKLFITGTDTGVGKTYISTALLRKFNSLKLSTLGLKPVASGCKKIAGRLYNADALALMQASSVKLPYTLVNPYAIEEPVAPSIASGNLTKQKIIYAINQAFSTRADVYIIEGVGGWSVPINKQELMSDIVVEMNLSVVLVIDIKLGCLNHAILTSDAIAQAKVPFLGWIANCTNPQTQNISQIIAELKQWLRAPCLGEAPHGGLPEEHLKGF